MQAGEKRSIKDDLWLAVQLAWHLGYLIAIPVVFFGFGGAYLDKQYGTSPMFLFIGFAIAITLSVMGVKRKLKEILS